MEATVLTGFWVARSSLNSGEPPAGARAEMIATLDELLPLAVALLADRTARNLAEARARVREDRFNLVVLGEFKRGKSTLINALLERDVLPTGVVPLTSVVTTISAGERDRLVIRFSDGRDDERPLADLAEYVTESGNPGNSLGVELANVELDDALLRSGLELVDTPGIGSIHKHNTEVAREFLPRVDAALCVLDAGQPLSERERELFAEIGRRVTGLLMVVNKIDHVDEPDRAAALQFVRSALRDLFAGAEPELFPVSALSGDGLASLTARLRTLAATEREPLLLRSVAGLACDAALDTAQAARFESRAIELPLEELASRVRLFETRIGELRIASAEAGDLLERGIDRAVKQSIDEPLTQHARREEARLLAALRERAGQLSKSSPRELSVELELWIDGAVRRDFEQLAPHFESVIADQLIDLERRYAARIERIVEQVQETAENVFGTRPSDILPHAGLHAGSGFSFKLKDVEHALDMIVGFGRTVAPGALGRRLVLREAERRVIEMTDRHAGRLRSELAERVTAAGHQYRRELDRTVAEMIDAIRGAIDRAAADRRRGERHARIRLDQLAQIERRAEELGARLERGLANRAALSGERP